MGNESIDLGLSNIYKSWFAYKKGKKSSAELNRFQYNLEKELCVLHADLNNRTYRHGCYKKFIVCDNKRREISVALVRDRVVHRLVYDYLEEIYDKTFIYDAWSCRKGKGLLGAIERINTHTHTHTPRGRRPHNLWIWKCDIKKFFDNIDQWILLKILSSRIKDSATFSLLKEIINSFTVVRGQKIGMPIGNLTSQIFANVYLNELDRFVKHKLRIKKYVRYGDDFVITESNSKKLRFSRIEIMDFLKNELKLNVNPKNDKIIKFAHGLKFLGVKIWPNGRKLNRRNNSRIESHLKINNIASYGGLIKQHGGKKFMKKFNWLVHDFIFPSF